MAVYTHISAEALEGFLADYDVGALRSAKGIAEGVENSNYFVETETGRFILTLYEKRVDLADLPFFLDLKTHLANQGLPVPRPIPDRSGVALRMLAGRPACLIEFLPGVSPGTPNAAQCEAVGRALGDLHRAAESFTGSRPNDLGISGWRPLAERCGDSLDAIAPGLSAEVFTELDILERDWPRGLEQSIIHADLFPDNVLMLDDRVTGLIDFYFACTDIRAYDLAITHASWVFDPDGTNFHADRSAALVKGYEATHGLTPEERAALPLLARGASMRFLLTRAWDWLNTPADALVTRKDPLAFRRRLDFYRDHGSEAFAR